jgi:LysR family transcriptional regulator, hydrogen peroxide-inducible genes activator
MGALPSLRQLRYLTALADTLNFRAAAQACFVTQSTLSAGIKELESLLGVQLLERDTRNVRLTPAGEEIVGRARSLVAQAEDLAEAAHAAGEPLAGPTRLGVIPTIAPFVLPKVLPELRRRYPKLRLYLREDLTDRLLERLRSGELDFALIALPYDTRDLAVRPLMKDEFWFVSLEGDPLAKHKAVAVEALDPRDVVLLEEGHCLRDHALQACGKHAPWSESLVEATSLTTLLQMVEGGLGVTLLPEIALKSGLLDHTRLVARPFSRRIPSRTLALAGRPTSGRLEEMELLAKLIEERTAPKTRPLRRAS